LQALSWGFRSYKPSTALTHIDEAIETGLFSNRSDFMTQAVLFFIE